MSEKTQYHAWIGKLISEQYGFSRGSESLHVAFEVMDESSSIEELHMCDRDTLLAYAMAYEMREQGYSKHLFSLFAALKRNGCDIELACAELNLEEEDEE